MSPPARSRARQLCRTKPDLGAGAARGVLFRTARVGLVLTARRLLATADGGRRWTTSYRATGRQKLSSVDFVDARHGWIVASDGLLRTTDGGRHWHQLPATCPDIQVLDLITPKRGYAIASRDPARFGATTQGVLLRTADGGMHWHRVPAPPQVQSVCVANRQHAWLGAGGNLYDARGDPSRWHLLIRHPRGEGYPHIPPTATVECTGTRAAWALISGPGGEMSQSPHIGFHLTAHIATPLFAEPYFPHPGVQVRRFSPGSYAGPFAAISTRSAVFVDWCPACAKPVRGSRGQRVLASTAPIGIASRAGRRLATPGAIAGITSAVATCFPTRAQGWVLGTRVVQPNKTRRSRTTTRLVHTTDGGRTWHTVLRL